MDDRLTDTECDVLCDFIEETRDYIENLEDKNNELFLFIQKHIEDMEDAAYDMKRELKKIK